jgi:hypothetical protein
MRGKLLRIAGFEAEGISLREIELIWSAIDRRQRKDKIIKYFIAAMLSLLTIGYLMCFLLMRE